jgi:uncharacterized membrane protein
MAEKLDEAQVSVDDYLKFVISVGRLAEDRP